MDGRSTSIIETLQWIVRKDLSSWDFDEEGNLYKLDACEIKKKEKWWKKCPVHKMCEEDRQIETLKNLLLTSRNALLNSSRAPKLLKQLSFVVHNSLAYPRTRSIAHDTISGISKQHYELRWGNRPPFECIDVKQLQKIYSPITSIQICVKQFLTFYFQKQSFQEKENDTSSLLTYLRNTFDNFNEKQTRVAWFTFLSFLAQNAIDSVNPDDEQFLSIIEKMTLKEFPQKDPFTKNLTICLNGEVHSYPQSIIPQFLFYSSHESFYQTQFQKIKKQSQRAMWEAIKTGPPPLSSSQSFTRFINQTAQKIQNLIRKNLTKKCESLQEHYLYGFPEFFENLNHIIKNELLWWSWQTWQKQIKDHLFINNLKELKAKILK